MPAGACVHTMANQDVVLDRPVDPSRTVANWQVIEILALAHCAWIDDFHVGRTEPLKVFWIERVKPGNVCLPNSCQNQSIIERPSGSALID